MQGRLLAVVLSIGITAVVATEPDFAKLTEDLRGLNDLGDIGELFKGLEEVMEMFGGPDGCEFNCEAGKVRIYLHSKLRLAESHCSPVRCIHVLCPTFRMCKKGDAAIMVLSPTVFMDLDVKKTPWSY